MTTVYLLSKAQRKVLLVEDGYIGSGESGRTTAHITHALDDRYYNLEQTIGMLRKNIKSKLASLEQIDQMVLKLLTT